MFKATNACNEILSAAEKLAIEQITQINKRQEDDGLACEDLEELHMSLEILHEVVCIRKDSMIVEQMVADRMDANQRNGSLSLTCSDGCGISPVPTPIAMSMGGITPASKFIIPAMIANSNNSNHPTSVNIART